MTKVLMMNSAGVMGIVDDKYYITAKDYDCFMECTRNEFIEELKKMSWVCLTSWDEVLRMDYLELVDLCNKLDK